MMMKLKRLLSIWNSTDNIFFNLGILQKRHTFCAIIEHENVTHQLFGRNKFRIFATFLTEKYYYVNATGI